MDKKRMANNILEFLVDPTMVPPKDRLYFGPEEILRNEVYESAKADARGAYRGQDQNADFYPIRNRGLTTRKEGRVMDRRTLIASLDILSKNFQEGDPIAKDLRTMAYAVSKMADGELQKRLAEDAPDFTGVEAKAETFECPKCGTKVLKQTGYCVKCKAKVQPKKASEEVGINSDVPAAELDVTAEEEIKDIWNKEAADAVAAAILSDVKGVVAGKRIRAFLNGTGPWGGTEKCPMTKKEEAAEEEEWTAEKPKKKAEETKEAEEKASEETKEAEETVEAEKETEAKGCGMKPEEEKDAEKKAEEDRIVDTDVLSSEVEIDGVQFTMNAVTADEIDLSDSDKAQLDSLFKQGEMDEADKEKFDQLFR